MKMSPPLRGARRAFVALIVCASLGGMSRAHAATCAVPSPAYATVQSAINDIACATITLAAGTYSEALSITRPLSMVGTGSGSILAAPSGSTAITLNSGADDVRLQDMALRTTGGHGIALTGGTINRLTLQGVAATGSGGGNSESGLFVGATASIHTLSVTDSSFNQFGYGWNFMKEVSAEGSNVTGVTATRVDVVGNAYKGLYIEKLSNARFVNSRFNGNGLSPAIFNARVNGGIDINLKAGNYQNLSFDSVEIVGNAISGSDSTVQQCPGTGGFCYGFGLWLKARSDAPAYSAFAATLTNVSVTGSLISNNQRGILIGDLQSGAPNTPYYYASPTAVTVTGNRIVNNAPTFVSVPTPAYPTLRAPNTNLAIFGGVIVYTGAAATSSISITRNNLSGNAGGTFPAFVYGSANGWAAIGEASVSQPAGTLPSTCNYWGASNGASGAAPGSGTATTAQTDVSTPLASDNLSGVCGATPIPEARPVPSTGRTGIVLLCLMLLLAGGHAGHAVTRQR